MEKRKKDVEKKLGARADKKKQPEPKSGAGDIEKLGKRGAGLAGFKKLQKTDFMHTAKKELLEFEEKDRNEILENLVLEETMTLQESEELQAIMALDDAGNKSRH